MSKELAIYARRFIAFRSFVQAAEDKKYSIKYKNTWSDGLKFVFCQSPFLSFVQASNQF